jgi:hypothetical protein
VLLLKDHVNGTGGAEVPFGVKKTVHHAKVVVVVAARRKVVGYRERLQSKGREMIQRTSERSREMPLNEEERKRRKHQRQRATLPHTPIAYTTKKKTYTYTP